MIFQLIYFWEHLNMNSMNKLQNRSLIFGPAIFILFILIFDLSPGHPEVTFTAGTAILMAIWWITEAVPLAVTALLPIVLFPSFGIMSGKNVAPIYFNHIIFLFIGGFLVALAMEKWNLHKRIALNILLKFGRKPSRILLGFMVATAILSMWISNTATTMMMLPIAMAIIIRFEKLLDKDKVKKYSVGLFIGLAYSASIGGIATLVGTPPNPALVRIFSISFPEAPEISFATWFMFALPVSILFLAFLWIFLVRRFFSGEGGKELNTEIFKEQVQELGPMSYEEKIILTDFVMLIFLWLFRADIKFGLFMIPGWTRLFANPKFINDGTVAIAMSMILFMIASKKHPSEKIMDWNTARKLPWNIVLLFGGGFALASGFKESGLSQWLGQQLAWVSHLHPLFIVITICTVITFLTELTSNTATAQMLLPIIASLAVAIQFNPLFLMVPATLSCSFAFMLPVATPPNAIVFGSERLKIIDMVKTGIWMNFAGVILITAAIFLLGKAIFGIDLSVMPAWAH